MPAYVLYGDSFLVPQELKRLEADAGAEALLEANRHQLRGSQARPAEVVAVCNALPFMDARRLVVVEGLLATLERRGGRSRGRGANSRPAASSLGGWEELAQAIPQMPETTLLVFLDGPLGETNPLLRLLRPVVQVRELAAPTGEALARWIKASAQEKGASISPAAITSLTDLVGNDLWTLDRELEKLSLYVAGRNGKSAQSGVIQEADVRDLVTQVREANIFATVDAMLDGRPGVALRLLRQLQEDGREASYIIAMVERQLRLLALVRDCMDRGVPQRELGSRLGISSQFVLRKTTDQARRNSRQDIAWRFQRLLEADLSIKQGRWEPDLALELLVVDLAGAGRPTPPAAPGYSRRPDALG